MPNFNAFMHRRNIFRKEPDFKKLACDYQELKQFMTVSSKNKLKFDFKNPEALRALTCALLHRYFQKRISLPPDRLIPAVPQRLNYICWVEDLVKLLEIDNSDSNVLGFDIGTGASCIFPILACHRNPTWSFIGVEADAKSYSVAVENVQKNFMEDRIRLVKITTEDTLNDIVSLSSFPVTFIMCNPPFFEEEYGVTLEVCPNGSARPKSSSNTSDKIESVISGGEISFVGHILEQSRHLKEDVTIYTSMLGKKQSLTHFKQTLFGLNDDNLTWTWAELCQGKTIRYAIAWSFKPGLDLSRAPPLRHGKNKSWKFKLLRKMAKRDCHLELMENGELLKNLVTRELMIAKNRVTKQTPQQFEMLIKTNDRTWSNQRRKRREHLNKHKHQATSSSMGFPSSGHKAPATSPVSPQHLSSANDICYQTFDGSTQMVCDSDSSPTKDNISQFKEDRKSASIDSDTERVDSNEYFDMNADLYSQEIIASLKNFASHQQGNMKQQPAAGGKLLSSNSTGPEMQLLHASAHETSSLATASIIEALEGGPAGDMLNSSALSRKRKNPSTCSSSPSRVCPSPNDDHTDDDNQSTDNTDNNGNLEQDDDSMNGITDIKRICIKDTDDSENMDDIYDYMLCCRISLSRVCHNVYFELKLEHPCTAASDAYDLFLYFRNKLTEK